MQPTYGWNGSLRLCKKTAMRISLALAVLLFGLTVGCRKRSTPATGEGTGTTSTGGAGPGTSPAGGYVPAVAAPPNSPAAIAQSELDRKLASGDVRLQLQVLDELLQAWNMSQPNPPKSLEDFIQAGMLRKLPTPPAGKRFLIDPKTAHVVLANQ